MMFPYRVNMPCLDLGHADPLDGLCQFERSVTAARFHHPRQCYQDNPPDIRSNDPVVRRRDSA